jgi:tetratricopeptide (TPR) repeat protein
MVIGVTAALLASLSVSASAQNRRDVRRAKEFSDQGDKLFRQQNYAAAIEQYKQAIAIVPNVAYPHFWKGYSHYHNKENQAALDEFAIALEKGYKPVDVYGVRWRIYLEQGNTDAAASDIQQLLAVNANNRDALLGQAEIYNSKGMHREALAAYQRLVALEPNNADLYYKIARSQAALGDVAGQQAAAEEAVKRNTQFLGDAYFLLGDAYRIQRRNADAIKAFESSLAAKPGVYAAYRNIAELYRVENRLEDAIKISKEARNLFPRDGNIYTDLSWYYSLSDQHEQAVEAARAAIQFLPEQSMGYTNLCRAYNDLKKYELAIGECNRALKLAPGDGETNFYLGRANDFLGREAEASKYYRLAVTGLLEQTQKDPLNADNFYLLGNAYFADKQREKAIESYSKALELNPKFGRARYNMGYIYVLQKNKVAANEQYKRLLEIDPTRAAMLKTEIDAP